MTADGNIVSYFSNTVSLDLLRLICGDVINFGSCRTVYECDIRPDLVLKFETTSYRFQNIMEWHVWSEAMHNKKAAPWLAPCEFMSPCGTVMAQKRTQPLARDAYPKKLPRFLTDTKRVQTLSRRSGNARMCDVTDDGDRQLLKPPQALSYRQEV